MEIKTALFAGSFDPFTRGHQALVDEALQLFDRVVVAVGENISKKGLLSTSSRVELIKEVYKADSRVEVISYSSLTGDVALKMGAKALIRGVRNSSDFEYEKLFEQTNRRFYPQLRTVILFTPAHLSDISSSTIRELLKFGGEVDQLLPEGISTQRLKELIEE